MVGIRENKNEERYSEVKYVCRVTLESWKLQICQVIKEACASD